MNILQRLGTRFFESIALFAAFFMIAFTFYGFSALTPATNPNINKAVLGAKTSTKLFYYPISTRSVSIVKDSQLNLESDTATDAQLVISFGTILPGTYNFPILQIKNDSEFPAKVKLSPAFSDTNTGLITEIIIDGIAIPVIDKNGTLLIPEITIEPRSIMPVSLKLDATQKINTPVTLTMSFIRVE